MKISDFADLGLEQIPPADTEEADAKIKDYYASLSPARKEKADAIKKADLPVGRAFALVTFWKICYESGGCLHLFPMACRRGANLFRGRSSFPVTL